MRCSLMLLLLLVCVPLARAATEDEALLGLGVRVMQENIRASNAKDKDACMATVYPNGTLYKMLSSVDWTAAPKPDETTIDRVALVGKDADFVIIRAHVVLKTGTTHDSLVSLRWKGEGQKRRLYVYSIIEVSAD